MIAPHTWQLGASPTSTNSLSASAEWYNPRSTMEGELFTAEGGCAPSPPWGGSVSGREIVSDALCSLMAKGSGPGAPAPIGGRTISLNNGYCLPVTNLSS